MRKLLLMALLVMFSATAVTAQEIDKKELTKEEKKMVQARMDSILYAEALNAINDTSFILEADHVVLKYGRRIHVDSSTNFVSLNEGESVVQVAFNIPVAGPNGLGGVTVRGHVSSYKVKKGKRGDTYVTMSVNGVGISAQVSITLWKGSNQASVEIRPNFRSGTVMFNGVLLPYDWGSVFQGITL